MKLRRNLIAMLTLAASLGATAAGAADYEGAAKDAWLDGKLETAYLFNPQLNSFAIDTEVKEGVAYLAGTVESNIDKDLAEEIALGIEGIGEVKNTLVVDANPPKREVQARLDSTGAQDQRSFREWFDDVTTTAAVKSKLVGNPATSGLSIDVDTQGDIVTLSGDVGSNEEKQAAEQVARETTDVKDVRNDLTVE